MLDIVRAQMVALGLVRPQSRVDCNVFIKLDNLLIDLFDGDGHYYYVRAAETYDLDAEYRIAEDVSRHVGEFVPHPLAFFRELGLSCIVFEGIRFDVVSGRELLASGPNDRLGRGLLDFFAHSVRSLRVPGQAPDLALIVSDVDERFVQTEHDTLWAEVRDHIDRGYLATLPSQRQHGDFVPNNLGSRKAGLVVFDWEDFGKINLPGFDLAVLLASSVDFDPDDLRRIRDTDRKGGPGQVAWLGEAFTVLELDADRFWRCVPFYLFLFLALKDRYSPAIRGKVARAIQGLL